MFPWPGAWFWSTVALKLRRVPERRLRITVPMFRTTLGSMSLLSQRQSQRLLLPKIAFPFAAEMSMSTFRQSVAAEP